MSIVLWAAVVLIGGAGSVLRFLADGAVTGAAATSRSAPWPSTCPAR